MKKSITSKKEVISKEDWERLPKGPREEFLVHLPYEKIVFLCKQSEILNQSCQDSNFWLRKLKYDGYLLPSNFTEWVQYWKTSRETEAQFLMRIFQHQRISNYNVEKLIKLDEVIKDSINLLKLPATFPIKEYNSILKKFDTSHFKEKKGKTLTLNSNYP